MQCLRTENVCHHELMVLYLFPQFPLFDIICYESNTKTKKTKEWIMHKDGQCNWLKSSKPSIVDENQTRL